MGDWNYLNAYYVAGWQSQKFTETVSLRAAAYTASLLVTGFEEKTFNTTYIPYVWGKTHQIVCLKTLI